MRSFCRDFKLASVVHGRYPLNFLRDETERSVSHKTLCFRRLVSEYVRRNVSFPHSALVLFIYSEVLSMFCRKSFANAKLDVPDHGLFSTGSYELNNLNCVCPACYSYCPALYQHISRVNMVICLVVCFSMAVVLRRQPFTE